MEGRIILMIVIIKFIGREIKGILRRDERSGQEWLKEEIEIVDLVENESIYKIVQGGKVMNGKLEWIKEYGIKVKLRMDGFEWIFEMIIKGIGMMVVIYES